MSGTLIWGLLLSISSCLADSVDPDDVIKCFWDPEYETFVAIAQNGLHTSPVPKRVVVVGAGMAGLSAAKTLQDAGHQVTILEVSDRIGGRVVTLRNEEEGWYSELGPMRIPITQRLIHIYVKKLGLKLNKWIQHDNNTWYLVNGHRYRTWEVEANPELLGYHMSPEELGKNAKTLFHQSITKLKEHIKAFNCSQLMSLYDSYSTKDYLQKEGMLSRGAAEMIGDVMNENVGFYKYLLDSLRAAIIFSDNDNLSEITGGFDQLPNGLSASLKPGTIYLRSKVEKVVRDGPEVRILYRTAEPTSALQTITADYVIMSASAKATRLITFQPLLSPEKRRALRLMHYTSGTKVILVCNESFWEWDGIQGGVSITDRPSRHIYYPSHSFPGGKGVLLASYTMDDDSLFLTAMKPNEVTDIILDDLSAVHAIPKEKLRSMCPSSAIKHWSLDSISIGAIAQLTPSQSVDYAKVLSQPEGRIYFAGEHTSLPHGWIDTAIKTGIQAARNIQDAVDKEVAGTQASL